MGRSHITRCFEKVDGIMNYITVFKENDQRRYPSLQVQYDMELAEGEYLMYRDKFGRNWKLTPNVNERIIIPFITRPILDIRGK